MTPWRILASLAIAFTLASAANAQASPTPPTDGLAALVEMIKLAILGITALGTLLGLPLIFVNYSKARAEREKTLAEKEKILLETAKLRADLADRTATPAPAKYDTLIKTIERIEEQAKPRSDIYAEGYRLQEVSYQRSKAVWWFLFPAMALMAIDDYVLPGEKGRIIELLFAVSSGVLLLVSQYFVIRMVLAYVALMRYARTHGLFPFRKKVQ